MPGVVIWNVVWMVSPGRAVSTAALGVATISVPRGCGAPSSVRTESAALTDASASIRPAPCSAAGAPRSEAVLMMRAFTSAGDGLWPPCVLRYAWMTSAASPAVRGAASLVPPKNSIGEGAPLKVAQSVKRACLVEHSAQDASPGASTSTMRGRLSVKPPELNDETLSLT